MWLLCAVEGPARQAVEVEAGLSWAEAAEAVGGTVPGAWDK